MPVTIRLMRIGKKGKPNYRIVAVDKKKKRNGLYLEKIGFYNPLINPPEFSIDSQKFDYWRQKGAIISEGIRKLKLIHKYQLNPEQAKRIEGSKKSKRV